MKFEVGIYTTFWLVILHTTFDNHFIICQDSGVKNYYSQGDTYRMAAEWEPALGTMIAWPLSIPYKLVVELASDNKLYTLVVDESAKYDASKWYAQWGIDTTRVTFIYGPQDIDVSWVRDWGPHAVFAPDGKMKLADPKYIFSTPVTDISCTDSLHFLYKEGDKILKTATEDNATIPIGKQTGIDVLDLPFISTGGNVMTDGAGTAFSSCILTNENRYYGVDENTFLTLNKKLLGIKKYNILSNFEYQGIQHIDCLMKLLDEERILVLEPPRDHKLYQIYEDIVTKELTNLKTIYGRPYKILRMKTFQYKMDELAAYSNSIILNKTIYVPLFSIIEDSLALNRWRELMPGYTVKGFEYILQNEPTLTPQIRKRYQTIGWNSGDALHCRTRAIWDPEMIYISIKTTNSDIQCGEGNKVFAAIIDYSKKGIVKDKILLQWRLKGSSEWQNSIMNNTDNDQHFEGKIPCQNAGTTVEYFISAESKSGRKESRPATAPWGYFQSTFK